MKKEEKRKRGSNSGKGRATVDKSILNQAKA